MSNPLLAVDVDLAIAHRCARDDDEAFEALARPVHDEDSPFWRSVLHLLNRLNG